MEKCRKIDIDGFRFSHNDQLEIINTATLLVD